MKNARLSLSILVTCLMLSVSVLADTAGNKRLAPNEAHESNPDNTEQSTMRPPKVYPTGLTTRMNRDAGLIPHTFGMCLRDCAELLRECETSGGRDCNTQHSICESHCRKEFPGCASEPDGCGGRGGPGTTGSNHQDPRGGGAGR